MDTLVHGGPVVTFAAKLHAANLASVRRRRTMERMDSSNEGATR